MINEVLLNTNLLSDLVKWIPDEVIEKLRECLAREVKYRAKKKVTEYLESISFCSDIPVDTTSSTSKHLCTSQVNECDCGIHPINPEVTKKKLL